LKPADNAKDYAGTTHTMPLLEDWGIECRLASLRGFEGVFKGFVTISMRFVHYEFSVIKVPTPPSVKTSKSTA
jgi:hypothetical protein